MEIHYADKGYRRRSIWILTSVVLLMVALLWQLDAWLRGLSAQLASTDPYTMRQWLRGLLAALALALALPAIALGVSLHRLGRASRLQGRFPPRQFKTLRDVRILRDAAALRWARRIEATGTAAFVLGAVLAGWALWALWYFR